MGRVSLLGSRLARPGATFTFLEPCVMAPKCPVAKTCQNLELGRAYRVVERRPIHHTSCTEHEGGVDAVEVEELPLWASLDATRLRGTRAKWSPPVCEIRTCPNWSTCFNPGMKRDLEYRIVETGVKLECPMGYDLSRVRVEENRVAGTR